MGRKESFKVPINKECLKEALQLRKRSIRDLSRDQEHFSWSSRSVGRGLENGKVDPSLLDALGKYLDVDPDYLAGKYHKGIDKIKDEELRATFKSQLRADKFPYLRKQQRDKIEERFLYDKYLEYLLAIHEISLRQFNEMQPTARKEFQLDLEDAIAKVIMKHFPFNALGQDTWPEVYKIWYEIDSYDPEET